MAYSTVVYCQDVLYSPSHVRCSLGLGINSMGPSSSFRIFLRYIRFPMWYDLFKTLVSGFVKVVSYMV